MAIFFHSRVDAARLEPFPSHARVRKVWLTREPWTIEAGLITPTMKLKREVLAQRFAGEIAALCRDTPRTAEGSGTSPQQ